MAKRRKRERSAAVDEELLQLLDKAEQRLLNDGWVNTNPVRVVPRGQRKGAAYLRTIIDDDRLTFTERRKLVGLLKRYLEAGDVPPPHK